MIKNFLKYTFIILLLLPGCSSDDGKETDGKKEDKESCTPNPDAETLVHTGITREYILYVPNSYDGTSDVPLFLNFHGFGGNASDFQEYADMRDLAESESFILVYPQGSCLDGFPHWNAALQGGDNKSDADDFGFVEALINALSDSYRIDTERVYAAGFSNGAMLAYALACYKSELITAIGSVSGAMLDIDCTPTRPIPLINLHGTSDGVLPYNGSSEYNSVESILNFWTDFNNTDPSPTLTNLTSGNIQIEYQLFENGDSLTSVEHYKIINGDHIWFDLDIDGRSTEQLIWDFVSKYDIYGLR